MMGRSMVEKLNTNNFSAPITGLCSGVDALENTETIPWYVHMLAVYPSSGPSIMYHQLEQAVSLHVVVHRWTHLK